MTSAIKATGLRKSFGGKAVLDGIDLEVGTPAGDWRSASLRALPPGWRLTPDTSAYSTCWRAPPGPERPTRPSRRGHTSYGDITFHRS